MKDNKIWKIIFMLSIAGMCFGLALISSGCAGGDSGDSDETIPAAPTNLEAVSVSTGQVNLTWTDNSDNESGFKIDRKIGDSGNWSEITTVGVNEETYQNTSLEDGTRYYYRVRAYNAAGNSEYSLEASATTLTRTTFTFGSDDILTTQTIGVYGGTLEGPADSPLEGVVVNFSAGALQEDTEISLGYNTGTMVPTSGQASSTSIVLSSSGSTTFEQPVTITVPFVQDENILVPYLIDDDGYLHAITLTQIDRQNNTATFQTFHASLFSWILELLGFGEPDSYVTEYMPGEDGFQIVNRGSTYNRGGECFGMTSFSLWYFMNHLSMGHFYNKYMTVVGVDSDGNNLFGQNIIATRSFISIAQQWNSYIPTVAAQQNLTEEEQFTVINNALLNTANPVLIYLYHDQTAGAGAHSVLAYAYNDSNISIYDPNHPNTTRTITYNTADESWDDYSGYDGIIYNGDGSLNLTEPYSNILTDAENDFSSSADATITVTSHNNGDNVSTHNTTLSGSITSAGVLVTQLEVFVGPTSFTADIGLDGAFDISISLQQGENHLQYVTRGNDAAGNLIVLPNDMVTVDFVLNGIFDLSIILVTLTWDKNDTDVDLYLINPVGDYSCYYHMLTEAGGELDYDDVDGYGPEHWTLEVADTIYYNQNYYVRIHYYSDHDNGPTNYTVTIMLYEGTDREATYTFRGNLGVSDPSNDGPWDTGPDWRDIATIQLTEEGTMSIGAKSILDPSGRPRIQITVPVPSESGRIKFKLKK